MRIDISFLPALAALLWWFIVPENNDRTPYKRGVRAELAQQEVHQRWTTYEEMTARGPERFPAPDDTKSGGSA